MIYQGGAWPEEYRDTSCSWATSTATASTWISCAARAPATSALARPRLPAGQRRLGPLHQLHYGPDGNVYFIDWYDKQACHTGNDRRLGPHQRPHLQDLVPRHQARGRWISARRATSSWSRCNCTTTSGSCATPAGSCRSAPRATTSTGQRSTRRWPRSPSTTPTKRRRLRGLWALHVTGGLTAERIAEALADAERIRPRLGRAIGLEGAKPSPELLRQVWPSWPATTRRRWCVSTSLPRLQRLPAERALGHAGQGLLAHAEDAADPNCLHVLVRRRAAGRAWTPAKALDTGRRSRSCRLFWLHDSPRRGVRARRRRSGLSWFACAMATIATDSAAERSCGA